MIFFIKLAESIWSRVYKGFHDLPLESFHKISMNDMFISVFEKCRICGFLERVFVSRKLEKSS